MRTLPALLMTLAIASCTNLVPPGDVEGIDVSHWQGEIDWKEVGTTDIGFAFVKATEGRNSVDPRFETNWKALGTSHIVRGAYHFLLPDIDGTEQARHFLDTVTLGPGDLYPVVDVEKAGPKVGEVLRDFLAHVKQTLSVDPIIYVSPAFWEDHLAAGMPEKVPNMLWIAEYQVEKPRSTSRIGPWMIWQYSQGGTIRGIKEKVDLDRAKSLEAIMIR